MGGSEHCGGWVQAAWRAMGAESLRRQRVVSPGVGSAAL